MACRWASCCPAIGSKCIPPRSKITLLHPHKFEYYRLLRSKLHWGRGSFNQSE